MAQFDLNEVITRIQAAAQQLDNAKELLDGVFEAGVVLSSDSEAVIEAAIAQVEANLPNLRQSAQNKLRGN